MSTIEAIREIRKLCAVPDADLNALAAIWAEHLKGWRLNLEHREGGAWVALGIPPLPKPTKMIGVPVAMGGGDTEYDARLALTIAAIEAERTRRHE